MAPTSELVTSSSILSATPSPSSSSSTTWSSQPSLAFDSLASLNQRLTLSSPTESPQPSPSNNTVTITSEVNTGAIIGGVIGGLAVLGASVIGILYLLLRYRRRKPEGPPPEVEIRSTEETPSQSEIIKQGGWGPSELPALRSPLSPVELPAEMALVHLRGAEPRRKSAELDSWFLVDD
ncbi:hypothetical protein F4819DRAFT_249490 [Hypoxylon fuscum]|nr:hypothetical protein F4819DRAFT_249490 [Hypoxylon fuscum]